MGPWPTLHWEAMSLLIISLIMSSPRLTGGVNHYRLDPSVKQVIGVNGDHIATLQASSYPMSGPDPDIAFMILQRDLQDLHKPRLPSASPTTKAATATAAAAQRSNLPATSSQGFETVEISALSSEEPAIHSSTSNDSGRPLPAG